MTDQSFEKKDIVFFLILFMAIIIFSGAWYYPFEGFTTSIEEPDAPLAVPFRYLFWGVVVFMSGIHFNRFGYAPYFVALAPFLPLIIVALFATLLGIFPLFSLKTVVFMLCMITAGIILPLEARPKFLFTSTFYILGLLLILSVAFCILVPSIAIQGTDGRTSWRGLFVFKQAYGWVSAITFVLGYGLRSHILKSALIPILIVAAISMVFSDNKGAAITAVVACGYCFLVEKLNSTGLEFGQKLFTAIFAIVLFVFAAVFAVEPLLELLGRDATLTGRTVIWSRFYSLVLPYWAIGAGPSSFTTPTELTVGIAADFIEFGAITQPHNTYIAVFGETGILGFISYVGLLVYLIFIRPFYSASIYAVVCSALGVLVAIDSFVETHSPLNYTLEWFLLTALYTASLRREGLEKLVEATRISVREEVLPLRQKGAFARKRDMGDSLHNSL